MVVSLHPAVYRTKNKPVPPVSHRNRRAMYQNTPEILLTVPKAVYQEEHLASHDLKWQQLLNVAAWLRFSNSNEGNSQLLLRVKDATGEWEVEVDKEEPSNSVVLLSARITLDLVGPIRDMSVILNSERTLLTADQIFIQKEKEIHQPNRAVKHQPGKPHPS